MSFPVQEDYVNRLPKAASPGQRIWLGEDARVRGNYFNCTLTSVFQPVRRLDSDAVIAHEAFVRGYAWDRPKGAIALQSGRAPASMRAVPAFIRPGPEAEAA